MSDLSEFSIFGKKPTNNPVPVNEPPVEERQEEILKTRQLFPRLKPCIQSI